MATYKYDKNTLLNALQRIQAQTTRVQPLYENFQPKVLSYQAPDPNGLYEQGQQAALDTYKSQVATTEQMEQNRQLLQQKLLAKRALTKAQKNFVKKGKRPVVNTTTYNPKIRQVPGGNPGGPSSPPVHAGKFNPHAKLVTVSSHGIRFTVNSTVANRFTGFLNALWKTGYHFSSVGGYANRNIAGTSTKSLHSLGLAIDVDPSRNPVFYNGVGGHYALPPNVGALAAKYGLAWGGSWHHKKDYMHFSVPYGGRE